MVTAMTTNEGLKLIPLELASRVLAVDPKHLYCEVTLLGAWPSLGVTLETKGQSFTLRRELVLRGADDGYPEFGHLNPQTERLRLLEQTA
jgi:hypothetical protein